MTLLLEGKHYFLKGKYFLQVAVLQILVFIEKCLFMVNLQEKKVALLTPFLRGFLVELLNL